jgi:hypothetical protein
MTMSRANKIGVLLGVGLLAALIGISCIPHCDDVAYAFLPGVGIAALLFPQGIHGDAPFLFVAMAGALDILIYSLPFVLVLRSRARRQIASLLIMCSLLSVTALGCSSKPAPTAPVATAMTSPEYPPRPTTPPPPFKLLHQTPDTLTLVVPETTTDTQLAALLYQLRDAARSHTFDALHIPQKLVDARDPKLWFHIYRGPKCAPEKYASGAYPCGPSYHAAADFTLGSFKHPDRTEGVLLQDEAHQTELWNPDTPNASPKP